MSDETDSGSRSAQGLSADSLQLDRGKVWNKAIAWLSDQPLEFEEESRRLLYGGLTFVVILMTTGFGVRYLVAGDWSESLIYLSIATYWIASLFWLKRRTNGHAYYRIAAILFGLLFIYFGSLGEVHGHRAIWIFTYPAFALSILGTKEGVAYTTILFVAWLGFLFLPTHLTGAADYPPEFSGRFIASFLTIFFMAFFIERVRQMNLSALDGHRRQLHWENAELVQSEEEMRDLAHQDHLTGIANRRAVLHQLEAEITRCKQAGTVLSIALLDIDHFKKINDNFGHAGGDDVLVQFVRRTAAQIRDGDSFGRYGGEEFLLLFPATAPKAVMALLERIRHHTCAKPFTVGERSHTVTLCAGTASGRGDALNVERLLRAADDALYRAKHNGRNQVQAGGWINSA